MKADLKNWSRNLHNDRPPDIFQEHEAPTLKIIVALLFLSVGLLLIFLSVQQSIIDKSIEATQLKITAGLLIFIPGAYQSAIFALVAWQVGGFSYDQFTL